MASKMYYIDFLITPNSLETYKHSLSAGVIYTENNNQIPSDGDLFLTYTSGISADFADNVLSAAGVIGKENGILFPGQLFVTSRGGYVYMVSGSEIPKLLNYIQPGTNPVWGIIKSDGRLAHSYDEAIITYGYQGNKGLFLPSGYNLSALTFYKQGATNNLDLYLCVNDDNTQLLENTINWETRTGENDIILFRVSATGSKKIDLTQFTNAIPGQEIILKARWNYTTSATDEPFYSLDTLLRYFTFYSGDISRNKWYHANWFDTSNWDGAVQINDSPGGIARCLVNSEGRFAWENWTAGAYNDLQGSYTYPPLDVNIPVILTSESIIKDDYIQLSGPGVIRYGFNKQINLINYLPDYLKSSEVEIFVKFFEDFLNTMYEGMDGYSATTTELPILRRGALTIPSYNNKYYILSGNVISGENISTSANIVENVVFAGRNYNNDIQIPMLSGEVLEERMSVLEKVYRLTELHDPDLIDINYIQFFAKNLGYNVNINRVQIGDNLGNISDVYNNTNELDFIVDQNKYLRFVVQNLPNWYKIKTTRNAIKVMLYSFGLIGDLIEYYSNDYNKNWKLNYELDLNRSNIPDDYFPTSHFSVLVYLDDSYDSVSFDWEKRQKIIDAIESVKPINTVFEKLVGYANRFFPMKVALNVRLRNYILIR